MPRYKKDVKVQVKGITPTKVSNDYILTSSKTLNELFIGWKRRTINTVFSDPGCGKTTLIMDAIINAYQLNPAKNKVSIVIDAEYEGFDEGRFADIVRAREVDEEAIDRLKLIRANDFAEQHDTITLGLPDIIKKERWEPQIIAVDPFTYNYQRRLMATPPEYRLAQLGTLMSKLTSQVDTLSKLAQQYNAALILVGWPKSMIMSHKKKTDSGLMQLMTEEDSVRLTQYDFSGQLDFSLIGGKVYAFLSKVMLRLCRFSIGANTAVLLKHTRRPCNMFAWYRVSEKGVEDADIEELKGIQPLTKLGEAINKYGLEVIEREITPEEVREENETEKVEKKGEKKGEKESTKKDEEGKSNDGRSSDIGIKL